MPTVILNVDRGKQKVKFDAAIKSCEHLVQLKKFT